MLKRRALLSPPFRSRVDISRILFPPPAGDDHSSGTAVADGLEHATRPCPIWEAADHRRPDFVGTRDCLRLHPVGFAVPRLSPAGRCALTAPFHPYRRRSTPEAVCFLWHFPWPRDRGPVGVTHHRVLSCSDFPPPRHGRGGDRLSTEDYRASTDETAAISDTSATARSTRADRSGTFSATARWRVSVR